MEMIDWFAELPPVVQALLGGGFTWLMTLTLSVIGGFTVIMILDVALG